MSRPLFDNYEELKNGIRETINRDDMFDNLIPTWIRMAEENLDRELRHPAMVTSYKITVPEGEQTIPLSTNYLAMFYIRYKGKLLSRTSLEVLSELDSDGEPTHFASNENKYAVNGATSVPREFEVKYYAAPPRLSQELADTLYLFIACDYIYFYATAEGFEYDSQLDKAAYWRNKASSTLAAIQYQADKERDSGSTLITFANPERLIYF